MNTCSVKVYAKINLTLEITGAENGYHTLDSLVTNVNLFDVVRLKKRKDKLSFVKMQGMGSESIPIEKNLAFLAAEAFSQRFGCNGVDVTVYKNIPMGAGLGGSSADVAGVINGMATMYEVNDEQALKQLACELGSDVQYMRKGGFARMGGKGAEIEKLEDFPPLHFLMFCPKDGVSSKECYERYDKLQKTGARAYSATENCIRALRKNDTNELGRYLMNDLSEPAAHLLPAVKTAMEEALSFSPLGVTMTGSGSAVLALFETKELCEWAKSRYRGKCETRVVSTLVERKDKNKFSLFRNPFALSEEEISRCEE